MLCVCSSSTFFSPLSASTYFKEPKWLANKHCIVNVQNSDNKCFLWSVLAQLHASPSKKNRHVASRYKKKEKYLNLQGLDFPLPVKQIKTFENNNSDIAVNVFSLGENENQFYVLYRSDYAHLRQHCINLLLLEKNDK